MADLERENRSLKYRVRNLEATFEESAIGGDDDYETFYERAFQEANERQAKAEEKYLRTGWGEWR